MYVVWTWGDSSEDTCPSAGGQDYAQMVPQRAPLCCLGHHWWLPGAAMFAAIPHV